MLMPGEVDVQRVGVLSRQLRLRRRLGYGGGWLNGDARWARSGGWRPTACQNSNSAQFLCYFLINCEMDSEV